MVLGPNSDQTQSRVLTLKWSVSKVVYSDCGYKLMLTEF